MPLKGGEKPEQASPSVADLQKKLETEEGRHQVCLMGKLKWCACAFGVQSGPGD